MEGERRAWKVSEGHVGVDDLGGLLNVAEALAKGIRVLGGLLWQVLREMADEQPTDGVGDVGDRAAPHVDGDGHPDERLQPLLPIEEAAVVVHLPAHAVRTPPVGGCARMRGPVCDAV